MPPLFVSTPPVTSANGRFDLERIAAGIVAEPYHMSVIGATLALNSGTVTGLLCGFRAGDIVTNIVTNVSVAGSSLTIVKVGIYTKAGVLLASSADVKASFGSGGLKTVPLSSPYTILSDDAYYIAIIAVHSGGAVPTLSRAQTNTIGALGSGAGRMVKQDFQTDFPNPATWTATGNYYWMVAT